MAAGKRGRVEHVDVERGERIASGPAGRARARAARPCASSARWPRAAAAVVAEIADDRGRRGCAPSFAGRAARSTPARDSRRHDAAATAAECGQRRQQADAVDPAAVALVPGRAAPRARASASAGERSVASRACRCGRGGWPLRRRRSASGASASTRSLQPRVHGAASSRHRARPTVTGVRERPSRRRKASRCTDRSDRADVERVGKAFGLARRARSSTGSARRRRRCRRDACGGP